MKMSDFLIYLVDTDMKSILSVHLLLPKIRKFKATSVKVYMKQLSSYNLH